MAAILTGVTAPPAEGGAPDREKPIKPFPAADRLSDRSTSAPRNARGAGAIGTFAGCTGTLIHPEWALTAAHCDIRPGATFCSGLDPNLPDACSSVVRVTNHPTKDVALAKIHLGPGHLLSKVTPIPMLTGRIDDSWVGRRVEAAGYGLDGLGQGGRRVLRGGVISSIGADSLMIHTRAGPGPCYGDSGGPALVLAGDGSTRLLGHLSRGDPTCQGRDEYLRADIYRDWAWAQMDRPDN